MNPRQTVAQEALDICQSYMEWYGGSMFAALMLAFIALCVAGWAFFYTVSYIAVLIGRGLYWACGGRV